MYLGRNNSGVLALFPDILINLRNISLFTVALNGNFSAVHKWLTQQ